MTLPPPSACSHWTDFAGSSSGMVEFVGPPGRILPRDQRGQQDPRQDGPRSSQPEPRNIGIEVRVVTLDFPSLIERISPHVSI